MIFRANLKEAVRSLSSAKQRTILALIGIVIGIGSVIAMVSIGKIVQAEVMTQFREMGTDILNISKDPAADAGGASKKRDFLGLKEALSIPAACPSIDQVSPNVNLGGEMSFSGKKLDGLVLLGVTENFPDINKVKVLKGRFISDLDENSHFCVLGNGAYQKLQGLGAGDVIGRTIKVNDLLFTVIGTMDSSTPGGMRTFDPNQTVYIHISTAMRVKNLWDITNITARVRPGASHRTAQAEVKEFFTKNVTANVKISSPEEVIAQMEKQMQMFTLLLGAIGSIALIVGGVGVMNVMLVSVTERRKEIGIRRALGARQNDIMGQFLMESIILSMIGGLFGILVGVGGSYLAAYFAKWQFGVSYMAIFLGVGVSSVVGIFFGFYPARQASRLDPIVALRSN
ncbi:MAG: ABC transporter permease [Nitrospirae bacterium]|nr:ABC transporter permease [Nitrospirota bacterium]